MSGRKKFYLDLTERVAWTAIQAAAGEWIATGMTFDATTAKVAGAAAIISVIKCLAASQVGDSDSAAALPGVDGP